MKIACQSCQAKYTIADEKVVGKVVKIRCKKCGSTIVVNGQDGGQAAPVEEPTEVRSSSAELGAAGDPEAWTVNVADNDQRTMTTHQIVAEFATGTVTDETYCWRDGMGDWLPLREIEELSSACGLSAASTFAQQSAAPQPAAGRTPSVRPQAGGASPLAGLFGSSPPAAAAAAAGSAAAARRGGRAGGADLFGSAAEAGGENDVMTSAPNSAHGARAPVDDGKMKEERNENSVLFSLNALTASEPKKNGADSKLVGAAEGDGSGLIDIRALSSGMSGGSSGPKKANHADDIMNLGGGGAFSAALAAPVLTAPPLDSGDPASPGAAASNKKMMMMFAGMAALLCFGMVGMYFALKPSTPAVAVATEGTGAPATTASSPAAAAATTPTAAPTVATAPTPDPSAIAAADPMKPAKHAGGGGGGGGGGGSAPVAVAVNNPPPTPAPPSGGGGGGGGKSLDQLMQQAAGGGNAPSNPAPSTGSSAPFDRGAASATLGTIAEGVSSCKKPSGPTGEGHVSITFSPSGSVVSAIVDQPPFAGTAVGGCVAGKFRGAHVPAFAGGNLTIGKRFNIN